MSTKYPHSLTLKPGTVFPTRWRSTNAVHYVTCPKCGAQPGYLCVTKSGRRGHDLTGGAHGIREAQLQKEYPEIAALSRITPSQPLPKLPTGD